MTDLYQDDKDQRPEDAPTGGPRPAPPRRWRRLLGLVRFAAILVLLIVVLFRWVNPPTNITMLTARAEFGAVAQTWVPLADLPDSLPLSAAAAEDANFCQHAGFDVAGIRAALADSERLRGGSTISQQVAKNVFLWQGRTWLRKGLETGFTVLIELTWPKRRIMEVYLNIAEFGDGVFGVEAAARHYFNKPAADLSPRDAARLMAVLPDPHDRSPVSGSRFIRTRGAAIEQGATTLQQDGRAACFL